MSGIIYPAGGYAGRGEEFGDIPVPADYLAFMRAGREGSAPAVRLGPPWPRQWIVPSPEASARLWMLMPEWCLSREDLRRRVGDWAQMEGLCLYNDAHRCIAVRGDGRLDYAAGFHRDGFYFLTYAQVIPDDPAYHDPRAKERRDWPMAHEDWSYFWVGRSFADLLAVMKETFSGAGDPTWEEITYAELLRRRERGEDLAFEGFTWD